MVSRWALNQATCVGDLSPLVLAPGRVAIELVAEGAEERDRGTRRRAGVMRATWWLGTAETWAPMELTGNTSEVPHWMASRSMASVSSLVHAWGAYASMPASNRPPPLAQDSNRMCGKRLVSRRYSSYTPEDVAVAHLALALGRQVPGRSVSVMVRFMSHLT